MSAALIAAILPAALDLLKSAGGAASRKLLGISVDDQIKLDNAAVTRLEAIAKLDNPYGTPAQWVVDLRASFRYIAAGVLILAGIGIMAMGAYVYLSPEDVLNATTFASDLDARQELAKLILLVGLDTASTPFSFIFGERMWTGLRDKFK